MSDLDFLRERIADYAGYDGEGARHQVDKQLRAYLGEALSLARELLRPAGPLGEQIDGLILRCEFSDQRMIRAAERAAFDSALTARIHAIDRELVAAADRIRAVTAAEALAPAMDDAARLLDKRLGALTEAPSR